MLAQLPKTIILFLLWIISEIRGRDQHFSIFYYSLPVLVSFEWRLDLIMILLSHNIFLDSVFCRVTMIMLHFGLFCLVVILLVVTLVVRRSHWTLIKIFKLSTVASFFFSSMIQIFSIFWTVLFFSYQSIFFYSEFEFYNHLFNEFLGVLAESLRDENIEISQTWLDLNAIINIL